jgi:hypothetical protein
MTLKITTRISAKKDGAVQMSSGMMVSGRTCTPISQTQRRLAGKQEAMRSRMVLANRQLALDYENVSSIPSTRQLRQRSETHFQTKLNMTRVHIPKKAPTQSTFPSLSIDDSGVSTNHSAAKRIAPTMALNTNVSTGSIVHASQELTLKRRTISIPPIL